VAKKPFLIEKQANNCIIRITFKLIPLDLNIDELNVSNLHPDFCKIIDERKRRN
jgi:hypothetical protein